jgi:hypothetical protein
MNIKTPFGSTRWFFFSVLQATLSVKLKLFSEPFAKQGYSSVF